MNDNRKRVLMTRNHVRQVSKSNKRGASSKNSTLYNERVTSVRWQKHQLNILIVISRHWVTMFLIIFYFQLRIWMIKNICWGLRVGLLSTCNTYGTYRTCINALNIWRSVCRTFKIGPYAGLGKYVLAILFYLDGLMHFYLGFEFLTTHSRNLVKRLVLKSDKRGIYIIAPSIMKE